MKKVAMDICSGIVMAGFVSTVTIGMMVLGV